MLRSTGREKLLGSLQVGRGVDAQTHVNAGFQRENAMAGLKHAKLFERFDALELGRLEACNGQQKLSAVGIEPDVLEDVASGIPRIGN
jgi:hypothetical protein